MDISSRARFHIAPGSDPALPDLYAWENRSADVNHAGGVQINGGRQDEVSEVSAGDMTLQVDNAGGHYCTRNPLGRWYGKLAMNTPVRWGIITGADDFGTNNTGGWFTPDVGTAWAHEGTFSDWSVSGGTGRLNIAAAGTALAADLVDGNTRNGMATFAFSSPVVATGAGLRFSILARRNGPGDNLLFTVQLDPAGVVFARIRRDKGGLVDIALVQAPFTYTANQRIKARAQWDGPRLRLKVWPEASAEPATWTALATDTECTGTGVGLHLWRVAGNTNVGTITFQVDDFELEGVEFVGNVAEFPVNWDPTATQSWVTLRASGVLRRLAQGRQFDRSPLYRQLISKGPHGYWPLEDDSESERGASAVPNGRPAAIRDGSFGSNEVPPGASASVSLSSVTQNSLITGGVNYSPVTTNGYACMGLFKLATLPASDKPLVRFFGTGTASSVYQWQIFVSGAGILLEGKDTSGSLIVNSAILSAIDHTKWFAIQLETLENGVNNVDWDLIWHQVGPGNPFYVMSGNYAGTADRVTGWTATAAVDNTNVAHIWMGPNTLPFVDTTFRSVSHGYTSEPAADRVERLATEQSIPVAIEAGDSEPMGPQRMASFLDLLRQTEATDMGILHEAGAYLGYVPRYARYNRPVHMALSISGGDIADPPPEAVDDDQRIRNEWTVKRVEGSEETVTDPSHIAANDRYPDSITIDAISDSRLSDHAAWRVHLGTWGEMRWPQVTLNFSGRPDLLTSWLSRPFAPRITISGVPSQGPIGANLDLIVEGWRASFESHRQTVTLNCSPARPWDVAVIDSTRADSETSRLGSTITSSATTIVVHTDNPKDVWDTAGGYDIVMGGEVIGVPAAGVSAVSGSNPYVQTITGAVRSKNGITKGHTSGAEIHVANARPIAL